MISYLNGTKFATEMSASRRVYIPNLKITPAKLNPKITATKIHFFCIFSVFHTLCKIGQKYEHIRTPIKLKLGTHKMIEGLPCLQGKLLEGMSRNLACRWSNQHKSTLWWYERNRGKDHVKCDTKTQGEPLRKVN